MQGLSKKKYMLFITLITVVLFVSFHDAEVNKINATMYAFSYKYGFISRGLLGTLYDILDTVLPFDLMHYGCVYIFTFLVTVLFYVVLLIGIYKSLQMCNKETIGALQVIVLFFVLFAVPMFCTEYNFGRLDVYCVIISFIGVYLLVTEKAEWLVVPLAALGVMFHQGYVFMFANILLVLLVYKIFQSENKIKYTILFVITFLTISVLFLYFELFSHVEGEQIYTDIVNTATNLCKNGLFHEDVIDKEIWGVDLTDREVSWYKYELIQFPFFILLMFPYISSLCKILFRMIRGCKTKQDKLKYIVIAIGSGTIIPNLLLKVDFGRWMFSIICYYCVVFVALFMMDDTYFEDKFMGVITEIKHKYGMISYLLLVYPLLMQPLGDVKINRITAMIGDAINNAFFHLTF